jgi:hypothetical protein
MNTELIQPSAILFTALGTVELGEYVQAITIQNSLSQPVYSCQITFAPKLNLTTAIKTGMDLGDFRKLFRKNQIIAVKINKSYPTKFLGFIDHIVERSLSNNSSTGRSITINCSGMLPKMLVRDNIVNAPEVAVLDEITRDMVLSKRAEFFKWERGLTGKNSVFADKPEVAIKWILNNAVATNSLAISFNGSDYTIQSFISDGVDYNGRKIKDFRFVKTDFLYAPELSTYSGTILNYLYECIDKDFYEIFFDATEDKDGFPLNRIVIRPKPYTYKDLDEGGEWALWEDKDLFQHEIDSSIVLESNLSQSDFELKNFFQCYFLMDLIASPDTNLAKYGYQFPIINIASVKKYGLRDIVARTKLLSEIKLQEEYKKAVEDNEPFDAKKVADDKLKDPLLIKRNKLMYWYGFPHYESGQITLLGGDYRIGDKVYFKDKTYYDEENDKYIQGVEYYISGVVDRFRYPNAYTTTLNVVRGAPIGFVPKWFQKHKSDFIKIDTIGDKNKVEIVDSKEDKEKIKKAIEDLKGVIIKNVE